MTLDDWLHYGIANGWCGPPVCANHDGIPTTASEDDDEDVCLHVLRLYANDEQRRAVEENHSPSVWRKVGYTA